MKHTLANYPQAPQQKSDAPWIMTVAVLSTSHMPQEDFATLLCSTECLGPLMSDIALLLCLDDHTDIERIDPGTRAAIDFVVSKGYAYLRFDPEGEVIEGLPVFDW